MKFLIILISLLAITGCYNNTDIINLKASPGEYESNTIGELSGKQSISSTIEFTDFKHSDNWPPAAYVGFYEGENNDESVQFLILRNNQDDEYFVAGYRVIEKGEETIKTSLKNIDIGAKVDIEMSISNGLVTLTIDGSESLEIQTKLKSVKPYISVSSSSARFTIQK